LQRPTISSMRPSLDAFAVISRQKMKIGICGSRLETLVESETVWLLQNCHGRESHLFCLQWRNYK
jgi:hypothetical protein